MGYVTFIHNIAFILMWAGMWTFIVTLVEHTQQSKLSRFYIYIGIFMIGVLMVMSIDDTDKGVCE